MVAAPEDISFIMKMTLSSPIYSPLLEKLKKLEARNTNYRFDLERLYLDKKPREHWGRWFIKKQFEPFGRGSYVILMWKLLIDICLNAKILSSFMDIFSNLEARKQGFLKMINREHYFQHTKEASRFLTFEAELFPRRVSMPPS